MIKSNIMFSKKIAYFLIFSLFLGVGFSAHSATEDTRYFVNSNAGFWKNSLGVRHNFENGFTSDLSDWQLRVAKIFGVEVEPVQKLYVLPGETDTVDVAVEPDKNINKGGRPVKQEKVRAIPSDQTPWGVEAVYGNPIIASTSGGFGINIAVLDTGVTGHIDLSRRVKECKDFTQRKQPVVDGRCDDINGHGTHVSGIIAADGGEDKKGIYGIAPEASLLAYKVCGNNGSCWSDDVSFALRHAVDNGANIINLSLGGDKENNLIKNAVSYAVSKGVLIVAAAGNDGPYFGSIDYPASSSDVIAVGAVDPNLEIAEWSSRGINSTTVPYLLENKDMEFAAPGVNIESTWKDSGYVILSGTSMAAPHISGLAAKLWQKNAEFPANATRDLLRQFSLDINVFGDDDASGWGMPTL